MHRVWLIYFQEMFVQPQALFLVPCIHDALFCPLVYRVKASAVTGQAKHAQLFEGGRAEHAAQCLDARQHQHQSHFRGGVSAELAGHRDGEDWCVRVPRAAGHDAGHKEREACLQGESEHCRPVLRWSGGLGGMLCNSWGINTATAKLVSIRSFS